MPSEAGFMSGWNDTGSQLIQQQGSQLQQALAVADQLMKQRQQESDEKYKAWSQKMAEDRAAREDEQNAIHNRIQGMDLLMSGMKNLEHPGDAFAMLKGLVSDDALKELQSRFYEGYKADQQKEWSAGRQGTQGGMAQAPPQPTQPGAQAQSTMPPFISPNAQMQTSTNPFLGGAMGPEAGLGFSLPASMPVPQAMPPTQDPFAGQPMGQDAALGFGPNPQADAVAPMSSAPPMLSAPQGIPQAPPPVGPGGGMVPPTAAPGMPPGAAQAGAPQGFVPPTLEDYLNSETPAHQFLREQREEQKRKAMAQERIAQMRAETAAAMAKAAQDRVEPLRLMAEARKQQVQNDTEALKLRVGRYAQSLANLNAGLEIRKRAQDIIERHNKVMESIASRNAATGEGHLKVAQSMANNPMLRLAQQGWHEMDAAARDAQEGVESLEKDALEAQNSVDEMQYNVRQWQYLADNAPDDKDKLTNQAKAQSGSALVIQMQKTATAKRVRADNAKQTAQSYRSMADGMRKDLYDKGILNMSDGKGVPTSQPPRITVPPGNLPVVSSQAQFDALPLNAFYRTMTGKVARKTRMTSH